MKLLYYKIKNFVSLKEVYISIIAIVLAAGTAVSAYTFLEKKVEITVNNEKTVITTFANRVEEAIKEAEIELNDYDYIDKELDQKLTSTGINKIFIKRAKEVKVNYSTESFTFYTLKDTIEELLKDNNLEVDSDDYFLNYKINDELKDGMEINIVKVEKDVDIERTEIPFEVVTSKNRKMDYGDIKIVEKGEPGIIETAYACVYENGELVSKEKVYETKLSEPKEQVEEHGIIKTYITENGDKIRYTDVKEVRMTAYTASFKDTDKHPWHPEFGITFTGRYVERGIVAVDPKFIPLESKMYVEIDGETPDYGFSLAADTGGAIKEDLIDLYFETQEFVDRWGTKYGRVYILADDDENLDRIPD